MKKVVIFCAVALSLFFSVSCDESNSTQDGYIQGIYTIDRNFVYPEMQDTFYKVNNLADFDLKTGDRAILSVGYKIDNVVGARHAEWYIKDVIEKIEVSKLTSWENVDTTLYSSAIISPLDYFYGKYWMWNKYQNIYLGYYSDGSDGDFLMSPIGLSGDTLCLKLSSKIVNGNTPKTRLLSFDLSSVCSMLSDEDSLKLISLDSIYTEITTKVDLLYYDSLVIKDMYFPGGKYKNNF